MNTPYTIFIINTKNHPKLPKICSYGILSKGLQNEFETAVVNESSVFEPQFFIVKWKISLYFNIKEEIPVAFAASIV